MANRRIALGLLAATLVLTTGLLAAPGAYSQPGVGTTPTAETDPGADGAPAGGEQPAPAFVEAFDGNQLTPEPFVSPRWDVAVHNRERQFFYDFEPMDAGHGPNCDPDPASHAVTAVADAVFMCRGHLMTAINGSGYGMIALTPAALVDFSQGEAVIRLDMSTLNRSGDNRDWWDVTLTPFEENLVLPADFAPDLQGVPRNAIVIGLHKTGTGTLVKASIFEEFEDTGDFPLYVGAWREVRSVYESFPGAKRRPTRHLRTEGQPRPGHVRAPGYDQWWINKAIKPLNWTTAMVQLGHHSYNPTKGDGGPYRPNTWHWDNVSISPALPLTLVKGDRRNVDRNDPILTLAAPAPVNARLRFAGIGDCIEVSVDGGATWQVATRQEAMKYPDESFKAYWTPIPAGTTVVQFRGTAWWGGNWLVQNASVWAESSASAATHPTASAIGVPASDWPELRSAHVVPACPSGGPTQP